MTHVLAELVLVFGVALIAAYLARLARAPSLVGFMVAGALLGPGGFGLIEDRHDIEILAEIGVVLLLFGIGLKISLRELWQLKRYVVVGGGLQVVVTGAATAAIEMSFGRGWAASIALGYVVALSSTAMLLTLLERRAEGDTPHGRLILGILLAQDLAVVPIFFSMPFLVADEASGGALARLPWVVGETVIVLVGLVLVAKLLFPWLANRAVSERSPELFTLVIAVTVFGTALFGLFFGLSPALGAFLAGVAVSSSPYSQHVVSEIAPFRAAFNSLFFVSIGMLASPDVWMNRLPELGGTLGLILVVKTIVAGLVALILLRSPVRALLVGTALAHVGEFSFVVAGEARGLGLLSATDLELLTSAAVPTMILAPIFLAVFGRWLAPSRAGAEAAIEAHAAAGASAAGNGDGPAPPEAKGVARTAAEVPRYELDDHVILVGFGIGGRQVARILHPRGFRLVVIELNRETLRAVAEEGMTTVYGDAARGPVLSAARIERARALIVTVPDPSGARAIVATARLLNPQITLVVRTRYALSVDALYELGADEVVVEEFESALELAGRVLGCFGASAEEVDREKVALRRNPG
jgi:CPA2 family monovalent cation:H+ antiporter-2